MNQHSKISRLLIDRRDEAPNESRRDILRRLAALGFVATGGTVLSVLDAEAKGKKRGKAKAKNRRKRRVNPVTTPATGSPTPPTGAQTPPQEDESGATPIDDGDLGEEEPGTEPAAAANGGAAATSTAITGVGLSIDKLGSYAKIRISMSTQLTTLAQNEIRFGSAVYFFQVRLYEEDNSSWPWGDDTDDLVWGPLNSRAILARPLYSTSFSSGSILWSRLANYGREYYAQVRLYRRDGAGTKLIQTKKSIRVNI